MANESDLVELLASIGDRAPTVENTLERLARPTAPAEQSHRRWLAIGTAVAAVAASVVVSVVVRSDERHHGAGAPATATSTVDLASYPLPLDPYYASATQHQTLERAWFVLARRCAQAHGVAVPAAQFPAGDPRPDFLSMVANDVRPLTLSQARAFGYDLPPSAPSPVQTALAGLPPRQLEIFQGWSSDLKLTKPTSRFLLDGGCSEQAAQTLVKGAIPVPPPGFSPGTGLARVFSDDNTVSNAYVEQARTGEASPEVASAQKRWSACMAGHGYPGLRTTEDAIKKIPSLQSASAKRQAVQDVQCKQATGFMTVWIASTTKAQHAVLAAHRTELAGFKQRLATRMANAAKALR